jgi:hypothetical protein
LGYAASIASGDDVTTASIINLPRVSISIEQQVVPAYEVLEAIVPSEWSALTAQEKQRVELMLSLGEVKLSGPNTRSALAAAFGPATTTRANLIALQNRIGSRAEALFGQSVGPIDIARALR